MKVGNRMKGGRREDRVQARFERMVARVNKLGQQDCLTSIIYLEYLISYFFHPFSS